MLSLHFDRTVEAADSRPVATEVLVWRARETVVEEVGR
jgi:hypothetical protein